MKRQEDTIYRHSIPNLSSSPTNNNDAPDFECRNKMLTWFLEIVDYFHYDKETVEIALNYLDRYECNGRLEYQLTCMAALYTAVKIHERTALHPKLVASLSQGQFQEQDVIQQERKLLQRLQWRMHPPTTLAVRKVVYELAQVQLQHAMRLESFRSVPAYQWAYAAVLNALESVQVGAVDALEEYKVILDLNDKDIVETQLILYKAVASVTSKKRSIKKGVRVSTLRTEGGSPRTTVVVI